MKRVAITDPDRVSVTPAMDLITTTDQLAAACARAAKHPYVTVDTRWAGIMDDTPDGRPLVGAVGGTELWVAAGFGGHGLPPALGVGRALADGLTSGRAPDSLAAFTPARFEREAA